MTNIKWDILEAMDWKGTGLYNLNFDGSLVAGLFKNHF